MEKGLYYIEPLATIVKQGEARDPETALLTHSDGIDMVKIHPAFAVSNPLNYVTLNVFYFGADKEGKVTHFVRLPEEEGLKNQERIFFALCYNLRGGFKPRSIVDLLADTIPHKRCWYYLEKWNRLGFYSYGVTLDLGWFYPEKIPPRYLEIIKE